MPSKAAVYWDREAAAGRKMGLGLTSCFQATCCCCCCLVAKPCLTLFATPWTVTRQAPHLWVSQARIVEWIAILQGIFLTQGSNPHLLHWQMDSLPLSTQGSPYSLFCRSVAGDLAGASLLCIVAQKFYPLGVLKRNSCYPLPAEMFCLWNRLWGMFRQKGAFWRRSGKTGLRRPATHLEFCATVGNSSEMSRVSNSEKNCTRSG